MEESVEENTTIRGTSQIGALEISVNLNVKCVAFDYWHGFNQQFNHSSSSINANNQTSMFATIATPYTASDSSWYPDSGTMNHIKLDANKPGQQK